MTADLTNAGLFGIAVAVLYAAKKYMVRTEIRKISNATGHALQQDSLIYRAAEAFAAGQPAEEVRQMLTGSFQLSEEQNDRLLELALPHRGQPDGGYASFLKAANDVLGTEIYQGAANLNEAEPIPTA
ncbi:hypothetical protein [Paenibacillus sp. NFR01]|uniref:hypothetical protein n=1 Tax=Paenibacillus sp. NFR01 TaxID=1566279 RepID=UPI0008BF8355|nr:hypothetical protein [Paenibacillus sp. NFR01]SET60320.1 hypothetical protein SAMN03159358_2153 [Paenibacillus sp. NFR01]